MIISCSYITASDIKTSPITTSTDKFKLVYKKQDYSNLKNTFLEGNDLFSISGVEGVSIYSLKDYNLVKNIKTKESDIVSNQIIDNGQTFVLTTDMSARFWDTKNWKQLKKIESKSFSRVGGMSENGRVLYFDGSLWSTDTYKKIIHFEDEPTPSGYSFSKDGKYFIAGGSYYGTTVVNINDKSVSTKRIHNLSDVHFRNDNNYYASYNAKFIVEQGGYRAKTIGLYNIESNDPIYDYTSNSRITCWTTVDTNEILVSLFNGDIVLLNDKLDITHKWHIDNDHIYSCEKGNNNEVWLGGKKSGLYKADLINKTLSKTYDTENMITNLKASTDNKHLGLVEAITGGSIVKIFDLEKSR